jgi:hypothetical protein
MANSKKKVNKSAAIRDALAQNPKASSRDIVKVLGDQGIKVAPTLVYYIKSKERRAKRRASRQSGSGPVQLILQVRKLAAEAGGIQSLKQLVDALAE